MSTEALRWAKLQKVGGPGPKLVLKTLADYANEDHYAWPARTTIADEAEISLDSVDRHLRHLQSLGLITKQKRFAADAKVHLSSIYRLNLDHGIQKRPPRPNDLEGGGSRNLRPRTMVLEPELDFERGGAADCGQGSRTGAATVAASSAATVAASSAATGSRKLCGPNPIEEPQQEPAATAAERAGGREAASPSKSVFDQVARTCQVALDSLAPCDPVIGPAVKLFADYGEAPALAALIDSARASRNPIRTWALLAVKARERLDAPPIPSIPQTNGANHATHRPPSYRDIADADIERLERLERERAKPGPMLRIASG